MELVPTVMLLSPARLDGKRAEILVNPEAGFALAKELRSPLGAPLGSVFSFLSGLYFRGKAAYAREFGRAPAGLSGAFVITAGGGLCSLDERVTLERLRGWAKVSVHEDNPHFTAPLQRHASELLDAHGEASRFVLLGSVATNKYVRPLLDVFAERLLFPTEFSGLGDMSRGALLLRAVREKRELSYEPLAEALRSGARRGKQRVQAR
jgi:hypothetical protein